MCLGLVVYQFCRNTPYSPICYSFFLLFFPPSFPPSPYRTKDKKLKFPLLNSTPSSSAIKAGSSLTPAAGKNIATNTSPALGKSVFLICAFPVYSVSLARVSTRVVVVVVRELFSLVTSAICVRIGGHRSEVTRIVYHMAPVFVYCCILTTVDS